MTYFPKTAYWITLYPNYESVDKTNNPQFKNTRDPPVAENESQVFMVKHNFSLWFSIPVLTSSYKNIKKFVSKIFKHTISDKPDVK